VVPITLSETLQKSSQLGGRFTAQANVPAQEMMLKTLEKMQDGLDTALAQDM
jgi:hypothetical protein